MHTTGLAEPIGRLYEADALGSALREARARTLAIYGHLDLETLRVPCIPIVNPPLWELAHIAWFQEHWCLRHSPRKGRLVRDSILPRADVLFNSSTVPHGSRWQLDYPPARELFGYMRATLEATLAALEDDAPERRYFHRLALLHEDMHGEALLMTLQALGLPPPPIDAAEPAPSPRESHLDVDFAGGTFLLGTEDGCADFVFDNEKWAHPVHVGPFAISAAPVTQGQYRLFVEDRGYSRDELWTGEARRWKDGMEAPRHWKRDGSAWLVRRFDRWLPLDDGAPMVHVSLHEALAWCRWAGRRLPSEAEWEFAARNGGELRRYPWGDEPAAGGALDFRHRGPTLGVDDPRPDPKGLRLMMGGVWEWTSSRFQPYPAFRADPYADYSQPWFHSHYVLRGGSFATRSRLVHNRFRNFYLPERCDAFAGFRTCII